MRSLIFSICAPICFSFCCLHHEVYGLQSNNGIKLITWKDKRYVLMIYAKPSHSATLVDTRRTNKTNERIMKPQVIVDYDKEKQVIELSDQLST